MNQNVTVVWQEYAEIGIMNGRSKFKIEGYLVELYFFPKDIEEIRDMTMDIKLTLDKKAYCQIPELIAKYGLANVFTILDGVYKDQYRDYIKYICKFLEENKLKVNNSSVYRVMITGKNDNKRRGFDSSFIQKRGHLFLKTIMDTVKAYLEKNKWQLREILTNKNHIQFMSFQKTRTQAELSKIILTECREEFKFFLKELATHYTQEFKIISYYNFCRYLIDGVMDDEEPYRVVILGYDERIMSDIKQIVDEEYLSQVRQFTKKDVIKQGDIWYSFFLRGNSLNRTSFDFTMFGKIPLKEEVKEYIYYYLHVLKSKPRQVMKRLNYLKKIFGILLESNQNIRYARDITFANMKGCIIQIEIKIKEEEGSFTSYRRMISEIRMFIDFIQEKEDYLYKPKENHFRKVKFINSVLMEENSATEYIPENIIEAIQNYIVELPEYIQRVWFIMINTGMRVSEVLFLEEDRLRYEKEKNIFTLEYIPEKIIKARKNKALPLYHQIPVNLTVAECFVDQKEHTELLREESGFKQIFLSKGIKKDVITVVCSQTINNRINGLIQKHNIRDAEGNLYSYKNRQCRKTVAVDLMTKGVSAEQVADVLAHMNTKTTFTYYRDVERKKLAEMESEFYEALLQEICPSDSEMRKIILKEMTSGFREVEDGQCIKQVSMGVCKRKGCAGCSYLITGPEKLERWLSLHESQKKVIRELEQYYMEEGINDFEIYREYQSEIHLLKLYEDIIEKINIKMQKIENSRIDYV